MFKKNVVWLILLLIFSGCQLNYKFGDNGTKSQPKQTGETKQNITVLIKEAFKEKYPDWEMSKVKVDVGDSTDEHASGGVSFADEIGGGWWLAAKVNNRWKIVADGNGTVSCLEIDPYDFSTEMVPFCYDEKSQQMIDRSTGEPEITAEEGIKAALELYHNYPEDKIVAFNIENQNATLAKGSVTYQSEVGGWWLAVKEYGNWNIITTGSDIVDCDLIKPYDFPGMMVTACYDYKKDQVVNRVTNDDLDEILTQVVNFSGVEFGAIDDEKFEWREYAGSKNISGRGMKVFRTEASNLAEVENYFKQNGFGDDMNNAASGTIVGLEGFARDTIVCLVRQEIDGGAEAMLAGKSEMNIEVKCGTI